MASVRARIACMAPPRAAPLELAAHRQAGPFQRCGEQLKWTGGMRGAAEPPSTLRRAGSSVHRPVAAMAAPEVIEAIIGIHDLAHPGIAGGLALGRHLLRPFAAGL